MLDNKEIEVNLPSCSTPCLLIFVLVLYLVFEDRKATTKKKPNKWFFTQNKASFPQNFIVFGLAFWLFPASRGWLALPRGHYWAFKRREGSRLNYTVVFQCLSPPATEPRTFLQIIF